MEPLDTLTPDPHQPQQPRILEQDYVREMLSTSAKWAKFVSIIGFIGLAVMALAGLFITSMSSILSENTSASPYGALPLGVVAIIYIVMAIVYFFPIRYLYQYAVKLKLAVHTQDESQLILALDKSKSHYRYIGILMVIMLGLYALAIIVGILAGVAAAF